MVCESENNVNLLEKANYSSFFELKKFRKAEEQPIKAKKPKKTFSSPLTKKDQNQKSLRRRKIMKKKCNVISENEQILWKFQKKIILLKAKLWCLYEIQDIVQERKSIEEMTSILIHHMW